MSDFWKTVSIYCDNFAPVAGPLLSSAARAANALHDAECEARRLEADIAMFERVPGLPRAKD